MLFAPLRDTFELVQLVGRHDRVGRDSGHGVYLTRRTDKRPQPRWNCQKSAANDSRFPCIAETGVDLASQSLRERRYSGGSERLATLIHGALHLSQECGFGARGVFED